MLENVKLHKILFIDIETVPQYPNLEAANETVQKLWEYRTARFRKDKEEWTDAEYYFNKSGVYAEFGKIVCISVGFFSKNEQDKEREFRVKSYYGEDEKTILEDFFNMLTKYFGDPTQHHLCGHNLIEFDVPFLARRCIIHRLPLPKILDISTLKPWEIPFLDTMRLWKFGDYRNYTSLHLLCSVLEIPTPKDDMEGKEVAGAYWEQNNLEGIKTYCQKDVVAVAQLILRFKGQELLPAERVIIV